MPSRQLILTLFLIIQIINLISLFRNKQHDYFYETIIIIGGSLFLMYLSHKNRRLIPRYILIVIFISLSAHTVGGQLLNLYVKSNVFDKYLHVFGTYSFVLLVYFFLRIEDIPLTKRARYFITIMIGVSLGTSYELVEFATDYFLKPAVPAQHSLLDTNLDLLADLVGAVLASIHLSSK